MKRASEERDQVVQRVRRLLRGLTGSWKVLSMLWLEVGGQIEVPGRDEGGTMLLK